MAPITKPIEKIRTIRRAREVEYPTGDGKPMAETAQHREQMVNCIFALENHYRDNPMVHVAGNDFLYYVEGDSRKVVSPDVYVVYGVLHYPRESYKVWKEGGIAPSVVFEFTSKSTLHVDNRKKFSLYEHVLKVDEYFRFDPTGDYLVPHLQGFRLEQGYYSPIPMENGTTLHSRNLGLDLVMRGTKLHFFDPHSNEYLKTPDEIRLAYEAEQRMRLTEANRADTEAERARNAEAELARLRAELDKLKQ